MIFVPSMQTRLSVYLLFLSSQTSLFAGVALLRYSEQFVIKTKQHCLFHFYKLRCVSIFYTATTAFFIQDWWESASKFSFLSDLSLGERKANIGPTFCVSDSDLVRWPAVVGTELAEVSVFLLFSDWKAETRQVRGPGQVGLCPERVTRGLRWRSLTSSGGSLWKWIQHFNLPWLAFGQSASLSNTTKLILLDSLLQEVCIKSGLAGRSPLSSLRLSVCLVQSQTFFIQD